MSFELLQSMVNSPNTVLLEVGISHLNESSIITVNKKDVETVQQIIEQSQFSSVSELLAKINIYIIR